MEIHTPPKKISGLRCRILLLLLTDIITAIGIVFSLLLLYRFIGLGHYALKTYLPLLPFVGVLIFCNVIFRCYHGNVFYPGAGLNKIIEIQHLFYSVMTSYFILFAWLLFNRHAEIYSRVVLVFSMLTTIIVLPITRAIARKLMKHLNFGEIHVVIAGAGETGIAVVKELSANSYYGFRVVGFLDDSPEKRNQTIAGIPVVGNLASAGKLVKKWHISYMICCLPIPVVMEVFHQYSAYFKHILFVPATAVFPISWLSPVSIGFYSGFEVRNKLLQPLSRITKFFLEVLMAASVILVFLPVFLVLALCVKLSSPGPVFYRSWRLGRNGKKIGVWKFRTMYADADARLEKLLASNPALKKEWEENFKLKEDPRITPIGNFLRKTSLDELPQFWNVLTGEMSIIGPRPIVESEIVYYGKTYEIRKRVKPGITGLWQVSGRNDTEYSYRVMLDSYYIINWSIWLDYYIFFKTILIVLLRKGAR